MIDYNNLSTNELLALKSGDYDNVSTETLLALKGGSTSKPQGSAPEALIQGFGQAATMGYLPQIQAAVEPAIQGLLGDNTDEQLKAQGFTIQEPNYTQRRDQYIKEQQALAEASPIASTIGQVAGGLTSGIASGGLFGGARAAGLVGRLGQAAKAGALQGTVRNPGDVEGEVSLIQPQERLKNVALDAATGAVFQGGLEGVGSIGKALKAAPGTLKTFSELKALKASGAMLKDFKSAISKGKAASLGQAAIDEGVLAIGDDIANIAKKARVVKNEIGNNIQNIYSQADQLNPEGIDLVSITNTLKESTDKKLKGIVGGTKLKERIYEVLNEIGDNGTVSMEKLREIRSSIDDNINFAKRQNDMPKLQAELTDIRNRIQQEIKGKLTEIDNANGTQLAEAFTKENRRYSNMADLSKIASEKTAREESNASFGLRERMAGGIGAIVGGGVGAGIGGPVGAAVGAGVGAGLNTITTKLARQYGTPFVAITANKIAKKLMDNPKALGKFSQQLIDASNVSPEKFVTTVSRIIKDPEYKRNNR